MPFNLDYIMDSKKNETKRELFIWKSEHDCEFLREVLLEQPHRFAYGSKERGNVWQKIADNLMQNKGMRVTKRAVRKRFDKLYEEFKEREKKEKRDSGIEVEYDEKHQALTEYHELIMDWQSEREQTKEVESDIGVNFLFGKQLSVCSKGNG